jgi:hypothetical protein
MIVIPEPATDTAVLKVIETWIAHLANANYADACALLLRDPDNTDWSPALLAEVLDGYAKLEGRGRVTPLASAKATKTQPDQDVDWWVGEKGSFAGDVHHSLPLNGVWSDITALFNIRRVPKGFALELDDIGVF